MGKLFFMRIDESKLNNIEILDRICDVYGFTQKIQLANHFEIAASSLSNRYKRGAISYDFVVHCTVETGVNANWLLTGEGEKYPASAESDNYMTMPKFTLSEGEFSHSDEIKLDIKFVSKHLISPQCVSIEGKTFIIETDSKLSDGSWLVDIEGMISIREITLLPAKRLHVAGGNVPFECSTDDIKMLGRVVGIYTEVN